VSGLSYFKQRQPRENERIILCYDLERLAGAYVRLARRLPKKQLLKLVYSSESIYRDA
jgi:hypothetical protein